MIPISEENSMATVGDISIEGRPIVSKDTLKKAIELCLVESSITRCASRCLD